MKPIKWGFYEFSNGCYYRGKYTIGRSELLGFFFSYTSEKYHTTVYIYPIYMAVCFFKNLVKRIFK